MQTMNCCLSLDGKSCFGGNTIKHTAQYKTHKHNSYELVILHYGNQFLTLPTNSTPCMLKVTNTCALYNCSTINQFDSLLLHTSIPPYQINNNNENMMWF